MDSVNDEIQRNLNGQRRMRCEHHQLFLLKQPVSCDKVCCIKDCVRTARWVCNGRSTACFTAVCLKHGKEYINGETIADITFEIDGFLTRQQKTIDDQNTIDEQTSTCANDVNNSDDDDSGDEMNSPIGYEDFVGYDDDTPIHTRRDVIPIYNVNETDTVASHYLWNNHYNLMRRSNRFMNIKTNSMLQHIVSASNNASVSLLYPEGQLFPRIFWCEKTGSVVGALPSFIMNSGGRSLFGMASLDQHIHIRLRDGDVLTSRENSYWHYLFDLKLNSALNSGTSELIFKRGFEFLAEQCSYKVIGAPTRSSQLPMSEDEATRRIQELCSLLKKGSWNYFLTITLNESETPGVREITEAIRRMSAGDDDVRASLTDNFLPFILRTWERFVAVFLQELVMRNSSILGPVKSLFYRFEFQSAGSKGNKPHVHAGITLHEEDQHLTSSRICCNTVLFHSKLYGADYESLRQQGIVRDQYDYEQWKNIVACVQHHDCSKTQFRCQKATDTEGNKICRYHRQPQATVYDDQRGWFNEITMPYGETVYRLLEEMQLAEKRHDPALMEDRWYVAEELLAGKWHYPSRSEEFFISSIPLVSAICRSATNVDMCDRKFQVSISFNQLQLCILYVL